MNQISDGKACSGLPGKNYQKFLSGIGSDTYEKNGDNYPLELIRGRYCR